MKMKLPIAARGILSTAILLLGAALLTTTPVQSAVPNAPNADPLLTLTKTVINDNGGTATEANFQAKIDDVDVAWDVATSVTADIQHTASEIADVSGYEASTWGEPCETDGTITLTADTSGTCSITNDDIPPSLTLTKVVNNNYGGTAVATDWTLTASGTITPITGAGGASSDSTFYAGTYTLTESTGPAGYTSGSWVCTGDGVQVGNQITLALGETASCTITSNDVQPQLTIIKNVVNNNGGTLAAGNFSINITGTNVSQTPITGAVSPGTTVTLNAGAYNVAEVPVAGYSPTYSLDCSGTINIGETRTCTITNDDISPTLTVIKNVINNGSSLAASDFTINVSGTNVSLPTFPGAVSPGTTLTLNAGSYNVSEIPVLGYSAGYSVNCSGTMAVGDARTCTITNTNVPAIKVDPAGPFETEENGATDTFYVSLTTIPSANVSIAITTSDPTEGRVDPINLTFNSANWDVPKKVDIIGLDDTIVDGDIDYLVTLDPNGSAANEYQVLPEIDLPVTNLDAPTIEWTKPVKDGEVYVIQDLDEILLEVKNSGSEPISKVRFYRWVPSASDWVTIGEDLPPSPFQETIDPGVLELGWNEIRAFAWGPPGPNQTLSAHPFIFIYKGFGIFLPLATK